ncbi:MULTISPECIES: hypothetical protein [unclassified Microbacterium]|uniref:hypothetical protein n=1 Tax=unclassified Microbacterium TaxID=2609290 RepID=UPI00343866AF
MSVPLVRTQHGAILGVDWRAEKGAVPGPVPATEVMPGDGIRLANAAPTVLWVEHVQVVRVCVRTAGGAEIVIERAPGDLVDVVEIGRFEPEVSDGR